MAIKLNSIDQSEQAIEENKYVFVLKHSETCSISANVYDQFNKFLYEYDMDGYYSIVQQGYDLSDHIVKKANVKHESFQAFYLANGEMVWNRDHGDTNVSSLAQAEKR